MQVRTTLRSRLSEAYLAHPVRSKPHNRSDRVRGLGTLGIPDFIWPPNSRLIPASETGHMYLAIE